MDSLIYHFALALVLAATLSSVAIRAPGAVWMRAGVFAVAALYIPIAYAAYADLLARPKPVAMEWIHRAADEAVVVASDIREGEAIYLWLALEGVREPRSYRLPWDRKLALELQSAQRAAEGTQNGVRFSMPFEPGIEGGERQFYAHPQPTLPPKGVRSDRDVPALLPRHARNRTAR